MLVVYKSVIVKVSIVIVLHMLFKISYIVVVYKYVIVKVSIVYCVQYAVLDFVFVYKAVILSKFLLFIVFHKLF